MARKYYKKLIEVMYVMRLSKVAPRKNEYQMEYYDAYIKQNDIYYKNSVEKMSKGSLDFKIEDFYWGDFIDFLKSKKGAGVGLAFPPTYKGGYEKMYAYVEDVFEYEHAMYNIFDPKDAGPLYKELLEGDTNVVYVDKEYPEIADFMSAKVNLGPNKHSVYIYSSVEKEKHYYVEKKQTPQSSKYLTAPVDFDFNEDVKITVEMVDMKDVNYFKAFYMANKVNYTNGGDIALMFFANGLAFGFATFAHRRSTYDTIFGLSDFVVNSHTKKLAKLLIMCELSHEVQMMLARQLGEYYTAIKTPVYTDKPVSMKYRGVFELEKREKGRLIYVGKFGTDTIQNIYKTWLKKHKG